MGNDAKAAFRLARRGKVAYFESALLKMPGLVHAFCTRDSGVSPPPFKSLNFSAREGDSPDNIRENRKILSSAFKVPPGQFFTLRQVHGSSILPVESYFDGDGELEHDAIVSGKRGTAFCIKTADCVPVLLADRHLRAVAAVHAGWRGTSLEIVSKTATFMIEKFGIEKKDILAAIGPAIGPCCYEVDSVVHDSMAGAALNFFRKTGQKGKWKLNLPGINRGQLLDMGIDPGNISVSGLCTACRTDIFFSHRAENETGRQLNFIMIEK